MRVTFLWRRVGDSRRGGLRYRPVNRADLVRVFAIAHRSSLIAHRSMRDRHSDALTSPAYRDRGFRSEATLNKHSGIRR